MSRSIVRYLIAKFPKKGGDIFRFTDESPSLFGNSTLINLFYSRHCLEDLRQNPSVTQKIRIFSFFFLLLNKVKPITFFLAQKCSVRLRFFSVSSFSFTFFACFLDMFYGHIKLAPTPTANEQVSSTWLATQPSDWHLAVGSNKWFFIVFYEYVIRICFAAILMNTIGNCMNKVRKGSVSQVSYRVESIAYHIRYKQLNFLTISSCVRSLFKQNGNPRTDRSHWLIMVKTDQHKNCLERKLPEYMTGTQAACWFWDQPMTQKYTVRILGEKPFHI